MLMSDSGAHGDAVYQPQPEDEPSERQPDMDDSVGELDADALIDQGYSPPDRQYAQHRGDSLEERLAREIPEEEPPGGDGIGDLADGEGEPVHREAGDARAGRLAAASGYPHENHMIAHDVGIDAGAASAEEAAMHVIEDLDEEEP